MVAAMPPHMPKQWALPSKPANSAVSIRLTRLIVIQIVFGRTVGGFVIIKNDVPGRAVQVIELAATAGPDECPDRAGKQQERDWNKNVQHVHDAVFLLRNSGIACSSLLFPRRARPAAFSTTMSELRDIPIAAIHGASMPETASGNAARL